MESGECITKDRSRLAGKGCGTKRRLELGRSSNPREPSPPAFSQLQTKPEAKQAGQPHGQPLIEFVTDKTEIPAIVVSPEHAAAMPRFSHRDEAPIIERHHAERPL